MKTNFIFLSVLITASLILNGSRDAFTQNQTFTEIQKLLASDIQAEDHFGYSVSISGDYAIVGAEEKDAAGGFEETGAAYIYERDQNGTWTEVTKLLASDPEIYQYFGRTVSISGDYAIVGAFGDGLDFTGAAYIFERDQDGNWSEVSKLLASDIQNGDEFGMSVSISGDYAVVGAPAEGEGGERAGAAYIYERDQNGTWTEVKKLVASDPQDFDNLGAAVAISGDYAIVGASLEDEGGVQAGAAYIYERDQNGNWLEITKLLASDPNDSDYFGESVSISGDYAIIGAQWEPDPAMGADAAYVFNRDQNGNWLEVAKLTASDAQTGDEFGSSVSISGDYAVVGASWKNEGGMRAGAAYIFNRDQNGNWLEETKLVASDVQQYDYFGKSVSISGDYVIAGAPGAYDKKEGGNEAGAAYLFENTTATGTFEISAGTTSLAQNYPNPFVQQTTIRFTLNQSTHINLSIYDMNGRLIQTLIDEKKTSGEHSVNWNGTDVSGRMMNPGMYFYRIEANGGFDTKSMMLVR